MVRFLGVGIAVYETVFEQADRPALLMLAAGCIGLPSIIQLDRSRRDESGGGR